MASVPRFQKAIRGYEKQVAEHLDKIAHPEKYVDCWCNKLPQEQAGLIKKWQKDIARNQKHADILKGLLESRR